MADRSPVQRVRDNPLLAGGLVLCWLAGCALICLHAFDSNTDSWVRRTELAGWTSGIPTPSQSAELRSAALDWTPFPALLLLAAGGLLGCVVFAGELARRFAAAAAWALAGLAAVHGFESWLLDRLATGRTDLHTYGLWLQATAFIGYALVPVGLGISALGTLTAVVRLAGDFRIKQPWVRRKGADSPLPLVPTSVPPGEPPGADAHWRTNSALPEGRRTTGRDLGICLSGGGIRSATFSLGALQALQRRYPLGPSDARSELTRARYLTAVSGGAYTAGALLLAATPARAPKAGATRDPARERPKA